MRILPLLVTYLAGLTFALPVPPPQVSTGKTITPHAGSAPPLKLTAPNLRVASFSFQEAHRKPDPYTVKPQAGPPPPHYMGKWIDTIYTPGTERNPDLRRVGHADVLNGVKDLV